MSMFNSVLEFHAAFGQLISEYPVLPELNVRNLRRDLLAEEVQEFLDADAENDLIEVADALADIAYIICGTAVSYGIAIHDAILDVSEHARLPDAEIRATQAAAIRSRYTAYVRAEANNDLTEIGRTMQDLMETVGIAAQAYSIPLNSVFMEVHLSNMNKLVDGKVLRHENGKVKKPAGWLPPNIHNILFGSEHIS